MIGRTISHYSVTEKLGAGGMGEVYRATDTKLNRDVALKVLPEVFASDAQRMARFSREAQVLASLNHPNIASIYGLEESGGIRCLVLELVEGPTLAERIAAGPLPAEEALNIARQIAEALEAAHEKGIIHRDLKPANVKVTPEGTVKVLDFGLAKALEDDPSSIDISKSPTLSVAATQAGVILGTAAYMSPEQARGQAVDKRADIWSFGVVLFEMLTGKRTFSGETVSDTLAAVLRADVDWVALPADTPASIRKLLGRCLAKDPKRRLQAIGEARITIEDTLAGAAVEEPGAVVAPQAGLSRQQRLILAVGMVVVAAAAGFIAWTVKPAAPDPPLRKFKLVVEDLEMPGNQKPLAISPNGTKITYLSNGRLWIRELHHLEPREVPGSQGAVIPFWSPDSAFLGYAAQGKLWKFPVSGGDPTTICDLQSSLVGGAGATWGPDGRIVFSEGNTALFEVSALGGDPKTLLELDPEKDDDFHQPSFLPDGRGVVFVVHRQEHGSDTLALFAGGTRKVLLQLPNQSFWSPVYSPTGHILYRRVPSNAGIWALPFSLSKLEVTGEPFLAVAEGAYPNVSSDGTLIYVSRPSSGLTQLAWVNRSGQVETAIGQPQQQFPFPALSPDGRRVAIEANENDNRDIWIHDVARGTKTRLTFAEETEGLPTWSPVGDQIVFQRGDNPSNLTIFVKAADGTGEARELAKGVGPAFSPDGKYLVYAAWGANLALDLWYRPVKGSPSQREYGEPVVFLQTQAEELWPRVSPDGRYLAYGSNESGRREVYVKMFPSGQGKWQVSVNGGFWPRWSKKGDKLYYVQVDDLMEVEVSARPSLTLGTPKKVFTREPSGARLPFGWPEGFDVAADGQRFVLVQNAEGERSSTEVPGITVVENWFTEFKDGQ